MSDTSLKIEPKAPSKPVADIIVVGELSPFEHEALYQLLKKHFQTKQPTYSELEDDAIGTKVGIVFHHSYNREFFTEIFQNGWRDLKELFKQINYRRGRLGAAFSLSFTEDRYRLDFSTGVLDDASLGSSMDQLSHLTSIVGQILRPEIMSKPLEKVEASFDPRSDRWQDFRAVDLAGKMCVFDESLFQWKSV